MYGYMAWPPNGVHSIMERKYFGCLVEVRKSTFSIFNKHIRLSVCLSVCQVYESGKSGLEKWVQKDIFQFQNKKAAVTAYLFLFGKI